MDTTETFIKMSEKAEKIQGSWKPKTGDAFIQVYGDGSMSDVLFVSEDLDDPQYEAGPIFRDNLYGIWLPRQDQLQEMSGLDWRSFDKKCLVYEHPTYVPTKEQAGIRVVEKEKYDKVWDGEDWVKGSY